MTAPDDYELPDEHHPRRSLKVPLSELSQIAFKELKAMYDNPFQPFPQQENRWKHRAAELIAQYGFLYSLDLIGLDGTGQGYQLTADGRYYMRLHLEAEEQHQRKQERDYQALLRIIEWEQQHLGEWRWLVADTY